MISVDAAWAHLAAHTLTMPSETVGVARAAGRVLARDVVAPVSKPQAAQSSMDGYAVRLADVGRPGARLRVVGEVAAGQAPALRLGAGEAARIFTGALLPDGADHILIQEAVERDGGSDGSSGGGSGGDHITYPGSDDAPRWVRGAGRDFTRGEVLARAGTHLDARHVALFASANIADVAVRARPRVAILAGGDELVAPGGDLAPQQAVDALSPTLAALLEGWGCEAVVSPPLPDDMDAVQGAVAELDADILLPVGGASVGDHDHMQGAFAALGWEPVFSKVAVRPGKPTWFSRLGDARALGLPGNPVSALVCAHLFLRPLLFGAPPRFVPLPIAAPLPEEGSREHFRRARVGAKGVEVLADQDSSRLFALAGADALVRRQAGAPAQEQGTVEALLLG